MAYGIIAVTTGTAILIIAGNTKRSSMLLHNEGSSKVYIGADSSVTSASAGTVIISGGNLTEDSSGGRMYKGDIYGTAETGSNTVFYWERTSDL